MSYFRIASCNSGSSCLEGKISSLETWNTQEANVNKALNALDVVYQEAFASDCLSSKPTTRNCCHVTILRSHRKIRAFREQGHMDHVDHVDHPLEFPPNLYVGVITTPHCHLHWWGLHTEGSEVFANLVRHPAGSPQGEKNVLSSRSQHQNAAEWLSDLFMPWTENDASLAILFTSVWVFGVGLPM